MELRELKKEVQNLPSIQENLKRFQENWIRPLRSNTNSHLPFLQKVDPLTRKEINQRLGKLNKTFEELESSQLINEKLQQYARQIVELKLTTFNGNTQKFKSITNSLLNDEFLSMKNTLADINAYEENLSRLSEEYNHINELLQQKLSLEETIFYLDLPHKLYLHNLLKISKDHKIIARDLGRHFISIAKSPGRKE